MAIDASPLAQMVAKFIDEIEEDYGPNAELADALLSIEIRSKAEDGEPISTIDSRSLGERNTVAVGICVRALAALTEQGPSD